MTPLDPDRELLVHQWIAKANADLGVAERLVPDVASSSQFREIVGFHCQQAAEKYLKAFLTWRQIEFPKTHDIRILLALVHAVDPEAAEAMSEAQWLTPFGVLIRYPGDAAEMLPGDERKALELARRIRQVVLSILG